MTIRASLALDGRPDAPPVAAQGAVLGVESSALGKAWRHRLQGPAVQTALAIAQRHGLPDIVARVMAGRGVSLDAAPAHLDPTIRDLLPEPYTLAGMEAAAERIARAIGDREKIAVFSDYDVDGATSAALMQRFLRFFGADPVLYIPDRVTEGYGPNAAAVRMLAGQGVRLLLTLDCGTTGHEALVAARDAGLDVVVIDHHQADEHLPPASAIVNPNRLDDLSGLGALAAVGVVFLVLVAVNRLMRKAGAGDAPLLSWLELVALGTVCDVVPLTGLNRAFVVKGLAAMRGRRMAGTRLLADLARIKGPPTCYHLGFLIGPRINAGGRIGRSDLGARLLGCDDEDACLAMARELDALNVERQALEQVMLEDANAQAERAVALEPQCPVLVVASEDWHPGIVGLIAARLKERFARPALALAIGQGNATGSARSIAGVDLGAAIRAAVAEGIALKGGGHAMAAGLTVPAENLSRLADFLAAHLGAAVAGARQAESLAIDGALSAAGATVETIGLLERAGPYGAGNPSPIFVLPAHRITSAAVLGGGHVRLGLSAGGTRLSAVAFRAAETPLGRMLLAREGMALHVAGHLRLDQWNGRERVELHVCDAALPV